METNKQRRVGITLMLAALLLCGVTAAGIVVGGRAPKMPIPVTPSPPLDRPDAPPLPPYILNMAGGEIDINGAIPGDPMGPPIIATPGARLEFAVRAEIEVKIRVHVKLFWRKGEQLARWQPGVQYGPFSTFRYRGTGEAPFGKGRGDLVAIVSPYPDIPDTIYTEWLARPPRHWQIMRQPVIWQ
jgi:hypothetical protein